MPDYQGMYVTMFRAAELAVRSIEKGENTDTALFLLKHAQSVCEEIYLSAEEESPSE